jgi:hypothetical protein
MRFCSTVAAVLLVLFVGCAKPSTPPSPSNTEPAAAPDKLSPAPLEPLMKKIGPAYQSLRQQLEGRDSAGAGKDAQQLAELFGEVERFWAYHDRQDAVKFAGEARTHSTNAAGAAASTNLDKAAAATDNLGGACKQCHTAYRESDGSGGYRIKSTVKLRMAPQNR